MFVVLVERPVLNAILQLNHLKNILYGLVVNAKKVSEQNAAFVVNQNLLLEVGQLVLVVSANLAIR